MSYGFYEFMPKIFTCGEIQHTRLTPDKELNILIYETPSYLIICRCYKLLKIIHFWPCTFYKDACQAQGRINSHGPEAEHVSM